MCRKNQEYKLWGHLINKGNLREQIIQWIHKERLRKININLREDTEKNTAGNMSLCSYFVEEKTSVYYI